MTKRAAATRRQHHATRRAEITPAQPATLEATQSLAIKEAADAVVQACCLVALVSLPLYFTVLSNTGYEADKAVLLRVLAAIAGAGWVIGLIYDRDRTATLRRGGPLLLAGLSILLVYALATALSIDPHLSLLGSYARQEGLVTHAAYAVFFLVAATRFRDRLQVERLITALLFGSLPVLAYGLAEQFGFEPIPSVGDISTLQWPVRSSFGQHVFLGSYLVMVIPFTAARLWQSWSRRAEPAPERTRDIEWLGLPIGLFVLLVFFLFMRMGFDHPSLFAVFPAIIGGFALLALVLSSPSRGFRNPNLRVLCYGSLLALQIIILAISGARGAWLGFLATIPVFGFLLGWRLRNRRVWVSVLAFSLAAGLFLLVLNIPGGPLQPLRTVHSLTRIADLTESGGTEVGSVKGRLLIWQGVGTLLRSHPAVGNSWGGVGRDLVGYGPESMPLAFEKVFPLALRHATFEVWNWDRAHDIYLDYLVDGGILALLAFLLVIVLFFVRALRSIYRVPDGAAAVVPIALAAAVAGHLVDGLFGLGMAVNLVLFWLFAGLMAGMEDAPAGQEAPAPETNRELLISVPYWTLLLAGTAFLALVAPAKVPDHPIELAMIWILAVLLPVACGAAIISPRTAPRKKGAGASRGGTSWSAPLGWKGQWLIVPVICLVVLFLVSDQAQFTRAAIAERSGTTNYALGDSPTAIGLLQQAARANSDEPTYLTELGFVYRNLASSASSLSARSTYHPGADGYLSVAPELAVILSRSQLFRLSALAFESSRALSPLVPASYENLGETYRQWKRAQPAIVQFREAQRLSHDNPKYVADEALAQIEAGHLLTAIQRARNAVRLDGSYWYPHYSLSLVYHASGRRRDAQHEAGLALFWLPVFSPQPPPSQVAQLRRLQGTG